MLFLMDFSRPDNARAINRLKVLSAIREHEVMTRAELSRLLLINKVSISEIVDNLIKQDLVKEGEKVFPDSGRSALFCHYVCVLQHVGGYCVYGAEPEG